MTGEVRYPQLPRTMRELLRWSGCVAVVWCAGDPTLCAHEVGRGYCRLAWAPNAKRRKCVVRHDASGRPTKSYRPPMMPVCSEHYFAVRSDSPGVRLQQRREGYEKVWWPAIEAIERQRGHATCSQCGCRGTCTLRWNGNEATCAAAGREGREACSACLLSPTEILELGVAITRATLAQQR